MELYTIGHSTRSLKDLIKVVQQYEIKVVVDVRHFPYSQHNPQFNKEVLEEKLPKAGIRYQWIGALGGFRRGGYRAYTQTKTYQKALERLQKIGKKERTVVMCSELFYGKCHRKFIAQDMKRKRIKVLHITDETKIEPHRIVRKKIRCD